MERRIRGLIFCGFEGWYIPHPSFYYSVFCFVLLYCIVVVCFFAKGTPSKTYPFSNIYLEKRGYFFMLTLFLARILFSEHHNEMVQRRFFKPKLWYG